MTESLHLYLNSVRCELRRRSGWPWKRTVEGLPPAIWQAHDPNTLELMLPSGVRRGTALHVLLGAALCKFLVVDMPAEPIDPAERTVAAEARMRQQFALAPEDWNCTVDAGIGRGQATVCAVRAALLTRLRVLTAAHGLELVSVRPYASVLWDVVCAKQMDGGQTGLLAIEEDAFTVITAREARVVGLHSLQHNGATGVAERELRRIGLSAGPAMRAAMWLAIPPQVSVGADIDPARLLSVRELGDGAIEADFRDLLLAAEAVA
jgi:hypothetical protein